jgi:hypothetical protein
MQRIIVNLFAIPLVIDALDVIGLYAGERSR